MLWAVDHFNTPTRMSQLTWFLQSKMVTASNKPQTSLNLLYFINDYVHHWSEAFLLPANTHARSYFAPLSLVSALGFKGDWMTSTSSLPPSASTPVASSHQRLTPSSPYGSKTKSSPRT